jgi:hypothetical protein
MNLKLIFLTFALVLFVLAAGVPVEPWPWRSRLIAIGLAFWVASQYPF